MDGRVRANSADTDQEQSDPVSDQGLHCLRFCLHLSDALLSSKKVNRKVEEEPQAEAIANPRHQKEEKKWQIKVCIANKQMHDKHKDQLPLLQVR